MQLIMYSRIFTNEGSVLYKETALITDIEYTIYEFDNHTYPGKPGKVYLEAYLNHPGFAWYLDNYDTAPLGHITTIGIEHNGDVEFYFENPENMEVIATYYGLPKPFSTSKVPPYQGSTLLAIRFNANKEAYIYKGYTTLNEDGLRPVAEMYIPELEDTLCIHHEEIDNTIGKVNKIMTMKGNPSAVIQVKPHEADRVYIDDRIYYIADYNYIAHNGYFVDTIQGSPWKHCNVKKLHEP